MCVCTFLAQSVAPAHPHIRAAGVVLRRTRVHVFVNDTATTEIYTLSLHDALPILPQPSAVRARYQPSCSTTARSGSGVTRSEDHTSELQSRPHIVCRLLLEKKNISTNPELANGVCDPCTACEHNSAVE